MKNTRFMEVMFSNTDEELAKQVDNDIKTAKKDGVVDTDELKYEKLDNGDVAITDKEKGEVTLAQKSADEADTYDLIAVPDGQLEKYLHPSAEGEPGNQVGAPDENIKDHVCPECGKNPCECEDEEREFSVSSDNTVIQRIFSDQVFCERIFSEVIESSETAKVGDLKIEKLPEQDNAVVVTNETTGDQAKVVLDDEEMEVTELDSKNFSEDYMPKFIVGINPFDHYLVDAQAYTEDDINDLIARLQEDGIEAIQVFEDQDEAREHAINTLKNLGASPVDGQGNIEEPEEQKEFSENLDYANNVYTLNYFSDNTAVMDRLFSEACNGDDETQSNVEEALDKDEVVETEDEVFTPVSDNVVVIEDKDNNEYTKAIVNEDHLDVQPLDEEEAKELMYSDIYSNDAETRFFSEYEPMTEYMVRLFSEEADQEDIEDAIESGEQVESDGEVITPIDDETAVIEDKENGEFTKATILDDEKIDIQPISEDEADDLMDDKNFSVYSNDAETRFFSEGELATDYMVRLFSEEADQEDIEKAIDENEVVETETEKITPIDDETAVVEDKENGEYTKATILDDEKIDVQPLDKDEAEELIEDKNFSIYSDEAETRFFSEGELATDYMVRLFSEEADEADIEEAIEEQKVVETETEKITPISETEAIIEDKESGEKTKAVLDDEKIDVQPLDEDEDEPEKEEKKFSTLDKWFSEQVGVDPITITIDPTTGKQILPEDEGTEEAPAAEGNAAPTVENIEDKALAAVNSIKAAAEEASAQILSAKAAPVETGDQDIQEAQFSEKTFSDKDTSTLISWLEFNK